MVREGSRRGRTFGFSERHVQAVWFDSRWRPARLVTAMGESVEVEYAGRWNLEAGPDFLDAVLRVGPEMRRVTGDVEVHVFPADWRHHGHASDPRYRNVVAHVTYFEGQLDPAEFPPGVVQVALRPSLDIDPSFAFEQLDVTSYPYAGRADVPPCRKALAAWSVEERGRLLESAGHARMRLKAERFAEAVEQRGDDQVLYESMLAAIGYQHNKRPFHALSTRLPVETLRRLSHGDMLCAYALLAGMSGLLPVEIASDWDEETRLFVRRLWDVWWKERTTLPPPLCRSDWHLHGIRPLNHPLRRLMAAALVFSGEVSGHRLISGWLRTSAGETMELLSEAFSGLNAPYWPFRDSLGGSRRTNPAVLLGRDRLETLLVNVVLPMAAALGFDANAVRSCVGTAKPEPINQIMKQTAFYLLGADYPSSLLASASQRQGLMQIFHDHCLHDRSQCARCDFPGWLKQRSKVP